jgi:hypothetical protein
MNKLDPNSNPPLDVSNCTVDYPFEIERYPRYFQNTPLDPSYGVMVHSTKEKVIALNNAVAVEPFPTSTIQTTVKGGLLSVIQKSELTRLKVIYGNGKEIQAGSFVYVSGEYCNSEWSRKVYTVSEQKFIMCPVTVVVLVENG